MTTLLSQPFFLIVVVPMVTVLLGVLLKIVSRNDRHAAFRKEDLAFGLDMSVTALVLLITESARLASQVLVIGASAAVQTTEKVVAAPWIVLVFLVAVWFVSTLIRKKGWRSETELNLWWGILLPDIFGLFALLFVLYWIAN